jgi:hypothetical protein
VDSALATHDRRTLATGIVLGLVCVGCVAALSIRAQPDRSAAATWTLYPVVTWMFVALLAAGAVLTVVGAFGRSSWAVAGATVAGVGAAQVAGMAVVAARHWHPVTGMGGNAVNLVQLEHTAVVLAILAGAGSLVALWLLWRLQAFPVAVGRTARVGCVVAGAAILVGMPALAGWPDPENRDVHSLLAYALMWSLTWGVAVALCGWLNAVAATAALGVVTACALLTAVLTPMQDIVFSDGYRDGCVLVMVAVAAAASVRFRLHAPD